MKKKLVITIICTNIFITAIAQENKVTIRNVTRPATNVSNSFYAGNRKPLTSLHFIKLPPASIQPGGWILKMLQLQGDGLTGELGNISGWLDKKNNAWFSGNGKGDHGWEEVPYWLKGYGDLGYILNDEEIIFMVHRQMHCCCHCSKLHEIYPVFSFCMKE